MSTARERSQAGPAQPRARLIATTLAAVALTSLALTAQAPAATPAPGWAVGSRAYPTYLKPGGSGVVEVDLFNTGAGATSGKVTVTDKLPVGMTATGAGGLLNYGYIYESAIEETEQNAEEEENQGRSLGPGYEQRTWSCSGTTTVTCTTRPGAGGILRPIVPGSMLRLGINVTIASSAGGTAPNEVTVSGGGAASQALTSDPITIGAGVPAFGFDDADSWFTNADGTTDTQAGSHPFQATFSFDLNEAKGETAGGSLRNLSVALPRGLVGNPSAVPECTRQQFLSALLGGCPPSTQVGVDRPALPEVENAPFTPVVAVYNLVPPPGVPAEFGFTAEGVNVLLDAQVRSGGDYGITEAVHTLSFKPVGNVITIWGVPGDPIHNRERCGKATREEAVRCGVPSGAALTPFLTLPTACEGPLTTTLTADTWQNENTAETSYVSHDSTRTAAGYSGCENLGFAPATSIAPDTTFAETPAGLTVEVKTPQEGLTNPEGFATSNIKDTTVTLPEGVAINPGQARGLQTCSQAQSAVGTEDEPTCPSASQVGTDEIETPLLPHSLKGNVYVLDSNPPNLKLLVAASGEGVNLKLLGDVHLDEATGRLTSTFKETPELPFTVFRLSFSGGAQAALYTPARCGSYHTSSDFTPWSTPEGADAFPQSSFLINAGPNGSACAPQSFAPILTAGSTTDQAGGYTNFSLLLQRSDGEQHISKLQFKTPKGLLGMISKVPLCQEPQAAQGNCPAASQIGHTTVEAGPGPYPLVIPEPGQAPAPIYLTGAYKGAPYGLSIAVPVKAGPFDLGTVVVRASIAVDPHTAQLTITTDPLPSILDGVPTDLRTINAVVDKPGFMFNPTNCEAQSFSGTAMSTEGTMAPIASHFQMGSCRSLTFKPDFKVSTAAQSSKANGASLDAKIVYPTTPSLGANQASSQSNIQSVKVDLPIQMPSRLTTLQKACLAKVFEEDPAKCPRESLVGSATAITPVLPVPLTGPAYFVSHGGEAFPSLIIVLQGYGVTVELVGETFISKAGITSSTFKQVPDVPVSSFELKLPQGRYSALGANLPVSAKGSFCGQRLVMPTRFTAQNGAVINQNTPIAIQGCSTKVSLTHKLKGKTLTLSVYAPAAGKIKVSAKGLFSASKTAKGQETVTIKLKAKRSKPFRTKLRLSFQPSRGRGQRMAVSVRG